MGKRYVAIWFRRLKADWMIRRQPVLKDKPFVMAAAERGRMVVCAVSAMAELKGIREGMVVADCKALFPELQVLNDQPELAERLLYNLGEWCIRYTPVVAVDLPDGLLLDISGCAHLWGGEFPYLEDMLTRLRGIGYEVKAGMADTIGAAWAISRYGGQLPIVTPGDQLETLLPLPAEALRLDPLIIDKMRRLGLYRIGSFMNMQRSALRRRFGPSLLSRLDQALGSAQEHITPIRPVEPYQDRLPSSEPILTAKGIEIALKHLLKQLCERFTRENKGMRKGVFKCYRSDHKIEQIEIGTNRASRNVDHLYKLFELKTGTIAPGPGIELFLLEAPSVEDLTPEQEVLWDTAGTNDKAAIAELLDCIAAKVGNRAIRRYLPEESHWPERSIKLAASLEEQATTEWPTDRPRPVHLLGQPEPIEVSVPIPDYPPMLFRYKGKLYKIQRADGPERIEQEWWLQQGQSRDYYCVEDEAGARYWLFRLGHYATGEPKWFIHGFFA